MQRARRAWPADAGRRAAAAGSRRPTRRRPPWRRAPRIVSRICSVDEVAQLLLHARQMAAGDVAAFVRHHADQLVGRLGAHDQAGIDEDALAARHEGVERVVLDDHDLDRVGIETGRLPDRHDHGADRVLDLGVADEIESLTLLRARGTKRRQREERETEEGDDAFEHGRHGSLGRLGTLGGHVNCATWRWRALFLLAACGRSETDRESDRLANAANPAGLSPGKGGLSAHHCRRAFVRRRRRPTKAAPPRSAATSCRPAATPPTLQSPCTLPLAVTLPSAAGLGASGACIVHDDKTKAAEAFVFPPIAAPGRDRRPVVHACRPACAPSR